MNKTTQLLLLIACLHFLACQQEPPPPPISTEEFLLQPGFAIEGVAAEPLLDSPVAMTFDLEGRIWVVELPGYMRDIDGTEEEAADGRIVVLEDQDGDGPMDKRRVFMDGLVAPRAIALAYNGLLYTEKMSLWWVALDGLKAGEKELVDSLYVIGGNIEHQPNGLLYHLDNWIYSAKSTARYRKKGGVWLKEATSFRGQWGITQDDDGRLYTNDNSNPLNGDVLMPNQLIGHPYQKVKHGINKVVARDRRLHLYQATAVNRGYQKGVLDEEGKVQHLTSACGPLIYRGHQLPADLYGDAFVCAPEGNLIKRYQMNYQNLPPTAEPAYKSSEFLISKNETFRPVNLYTGLDGALYVLDLRKGIIQHRAYMTSYLREKILERGLEKVNGKGRIYRIVSAEGKKGKAPDFGKLSLKETAALLQHPNGAVRSVAQQQLVFQNAKSQHGELLRIARDSSSPYGQIHALWTLEGLDLLTAGLLSQVGELTKEPSVFIQLLHLASQFPEQGDALIPLFRRVLAINAPLTNLQLCHSVGKWESTAATTLWLELAHRYQTAPIYCEALISGIANKTASFQALLPAELSQTLIGLALQETLTNEQQNQYKAPQVPTRPYADNRTKGLQLYNTHCASCHGMTGEGNDQLAPPILNSNYVSGSADRLIRILLHGLQGPIHVNGQRYDMNLVMPGLKDNTQLSDKDIADILVFVRNSFSFESTDIREEMVRKIRAETAGRTEMYTEEELEE